jgi:hypothetical protein
MDIRIETNGQERGCKVWLDDCAVSFASVDAAEAYVAQLKERIAASPCVQLEEDRRRA